MRPPMCLKLPLSQRIKLKMPTAMPQPRVGVSDLAHANRYRERGGKPNSPFNFCHHLRGLAGGAHPVRASHPPFAVHINLQNTDGVEQGRHLSPENPVRVVPIQMLGCVFAVGQGGRRVGNLADDGFWKNWRHRKGGRLGMGMGAMTGGGAGVGRGVVAQPAMKAAIPTLAVCSRV